VDAERVRTILRKLPHVEETVQWEGALVFWVGDKAIGGKMFAIARIEPFGKAVLSFSAGPERYHELLEREGVIPAPYMARNHWVAMEHWDALDARELAARLADAHALTYAKLPRRTREVLGLPAAERRKLIEERRNTLAAARDSEKGRSRIALPTRPQSEDSRPTSTASGGARLVRSITR
jgi:predicted DNA-binding protein (MmcQ/YjbR family)